MSEIFQGARSTFELKKKLMRAAFDGVSRYSQQEMIALINERYRRSRDMPEDHKQEIDEIKAVRDAILDCLEKAQPFEADAELAEYIREEQEREERERDEMIACGVPEEMLPARSAALTRLNAIERMRETGNRWKTESTDEKTEQIRFTARTKPSPNGLN